VLRANKVQVLTLKTLHSHGDNWLPLIGANSLNLEVDKCHPLIGENPPHSHEEMSCFGIDGNHIHLWDDM